MTTHGYEEHDEPVTKLAANEPDIAVGEAVRKAKRPGRQES